MEKPGRFTRFLMKHPGVQKWAYNASGFNKLGLHRDDLMHESPDVVEALRRLPPKVLEERNFRIVRAMQISCGNRILPKEQWTKLEEDVHYLLPYLHEVIKEREEKEKYNAM